MRKDYGFLTRAEYDLGLQTSFVKGVEININNCWHFYTDGHSVDILFNSDREFIAGMNRIYVVVKEYNILILAFVLMDTHVHFIIYGIFEDCNAFIHEYLRRTSMYITSHRQEKKSLANLKIGYQPITTDVYLKRAICYVIKNPENAGMEFQTVDYPWSSGPLIFRRTGFWGSPSEEAMLPHKRLLSRKEVSDILHTRNPKSMELRMVGDMIHPSAYVNSSLAERVFHTFKAFNYFMNTTRDADIETMASGMNVLSLPIRELRQHKNEICEEMFGTSVIRNLDTTQRLALARRLRSRFNCSPRQVSLICGLVYSEVEGKL